MKSMCAVFGLALINSLALADWPVDDSAQLEKVATEFELADGPAFDGSSLFVPDVKGNTLFRKWNNKKEFIPYVKEAGRISASYFNHGQLYVSDNGNSRIAVLKDRQFETICQLEKDEKPNDLVVDHSGGIYVTLTRQNQVIYITADGERSVAVDGLQTPNGIILSPDEKTLYVAAYVPKKIWAYDVTKPGVTGHGHEFAGMDDGPDKGADGMTIDRAGNVYCAGPKSVWIWSPSSKKLAEIETPTRPINCSFGDPTMQSLYITCFGGVYHQAMLITGVPSQPPATSEAQSSNSTRPPTDIPDDIHASFDVEYARYGDRKVLMDIFQPKPSEEKPHPAIIVVHGGGWLKGDKAKFRALSIALAKRGYVTAAIEYRLGGEAKFPAGIHDCNAAVRYLRSHAKKYGIDPQRIGAVGGSAGGHLVGLMATGWKEKKLQGDGGWADASSRLQAAIVMAGPMEMTTGSVAERSRQPKSGSNSNIWLGGTIDELPELYALADAHLHIDKDSAPILFMVGEHDKPERNASSREKLKQHGVWTDVKVYANGKHGCWNQLPWFNDMVTDMDEYFQQQLK